MFDKPRLAPALCALALLCGSAASGYAAERTVAIAASGCALAARHSPAADVAYQAGFDHKGRPVVPADVNDGRIDPLRESIPIIVSLDLQKRFGIPHDSVLFAADAVVGIAEVRLSDGRLTFNGTPLNDGEARALSMLCREASAAPR